MLLPLGSPIRPVPPPTSAIGLWPERWARASAMHWKQTADVKARRGRIEACVQRQRAGRQNIPQAFGGVVDEAAPLQFRKEIAH